MQEDVLLLTGSEAFYENLEEKHDVHIPEQIAGPGLMGDQKSWRIGPIAILAQNPQQTKLAMLTIQLVIYRVAITDGKYGVFISASFMIEAGSYGTNANSTSPPGGLHVHLEFQNSSGFTFFSVPAPAMTVKCNQTEQIFWQTQLNQDIYNDARRGGEMCEGGWAWYKCG